MAQLANSKQDRTTLTSTSPNLSQPRDLPYTPHTQPTSTWPGPSPGLKELSRQKDPWRTCSRPPYPNCLLGPGSRLGGGLSDRHGQVAAHRLSPLHSSSEGLEAPLQLPLLGLASKEAPGDPGSKAKMKAPIHTGKQKLKNKLDKATFWALSDMQVLFLSMGLISSSLSIGSSCPPYAPCEAWHPGLGPFLFS